MTFIPYGRQQITTEDIQSVVEVLESSLITQGPQVPAFEQALSNYTGAKFALACNSATSALHLACLALDVGPGDLVWTSATTFVASANCARYCGADADFVDIHPDTFNLDTDSLAQKLEFAAKQNRLPKVVVAVHLCGQSCDMHELKQLSDQYGFSIIEDASHAIGANYLGQPVGSCLYSDITIFSFHPVKIITTAEGGAALTNNPALSAKMELLRSHGVTRDTDLLEQQDPPSWYYEQQMLGYNYRMTELQAALGISQLSRLDSYVELRQQVASCYQQELSGLALDLPTVAENRKSSFHLYVIRLQSSNKHCHRELFERLRSQSVGVNLHYMPVYLQPYYRRLGFEPGYCPVAEDYAQRAISLPIFPALGDQQFEVIRILKQELEQCV